MYEQRSQRPISRAAFAARFAQHLLGVAVLLMGSLAMGIAGYMSFEDLPLVDAFLNAAMLLGGMGPVDVLRHTSSKVFAGCFALYSGLVFIVSAALVITPLAHRVLHRFHWDETI